MKELGNVFKTGTNLSVSVNSPCGYTLIEGAVAAKSDRGELRLVFPAAISPKMDHIPVGTQLFLSTEIDGEIYAYNGMIASHKDRPFVTVKVFERVPALEKRQHRRVSINLPMYCSVVDDTGAFRVIHDGRKVNGRHVNTDLSLSAGGFKVKTPFRIETDTMAIAVFFYPDESEHVVPVLSSSVYSHPAPAGGNYITGFRFSLIDERDRKKIDRLVTDMISEGNPAHRARKLPACLTRMQNN
ncbi:PilZ domain-containing protein [Geobacter argillaceus]|uniref:PilZ domain-containing protein n=1 Tax=Geobacter argillaceus TaxID=345631 RepID=A0A562VF05_9BACT|nr:PilZ domain-containing protein [Geobacter argillaceus]TWJ16428.1 PilZ domain-containing protein [Geobacter argillaceus]